MLLKISFVTYALPFTLDRLTRAPCFPRIYNSAMKLVRTELLKDVSPCIPSTLSNNVMTDIPPQSEIFMLIGFHTEDTCILKL